MAIFQEADAGMKVADVRRKHGISQPTYYNWKSKYGGMSASELKRIKELEAEHAKLKRPARCRKLRTLNCKNRVRPSTGIWCVDSFYSAGGLIFSIRSRSFSSSGNSSFQVSHNTRWAARSDSDSIFNGNSLM